MPGARPTSGTNIDVITMLIRLKKTPTSARTPPATTQPRRFRRRELKIANGTATPRMISAQNTGARRPNSSTSNCWMWSGTRDRYDVKISLNNRNASTPRNHSISRPRSGKTLSGKSQSVVRSVTCATRISNAVPETNAEEMNIGARIAVFQNGRATSRPKIHAVTECTSTAAGSATNAMVRRARGRGSGRVSSYRSTAAIERYSVITMTSQIKGEVQCGCQIIFQTSCGRPRSGRIDTAAATIAAPETITASRVSGSNRSLSTSSEPATTISPPAETPTRNMNVMMYMPQLIVFERPVTPRPLD